MISLGGSYLAPASGLLSVLVSPVIPGSCCSQ